MIELATWLKEASFPQRPWLLLGKGLTFSRRSEFDLLSFHRIGLDQVVRETPLDIAHIVDIEDVAACAEALPKNAQWLVMPRFPHVAGNPDPARRLESFFAAYPVLQDFNERGRLVWYDLRDKTCPVLGSAPPIGVRFCSSEAALQLLARLSAKVVRSLGIDGGRELDRIARDNIARENGLVLSSLIPPMRIFVGGDESEQVAAKVLEHTIRKHASGPVEVTIMRDYVIPVPKDKKNRARTKFSFYRFRIPELCGYQGRALYVDSDMQVFRDVAELWRIPFGEHKILCTYQASPPPAWKDYSWFHPGRQFSVMLLDCDRLPWRLDEIVRDLDEGKFEYADLLFRMCLVRSDEIGEMPVEWNHLETHVPGTTALTHFTVVPTQPWKTDDTPLNALWMKAYEEAVADGAIDPREVREGIRKGFYKRGLEPALGKAPAWSWADAEVDDGIRQGDTTNVTPGQRQRAELDAERLQRELDALRRSWTWRVGRLFTRPLDLFARRRHAARETTADAAK